MSPITRPRLKRALAAEETAQISQEAIARLAFELFERRGRTHGNDQQDWFEAERILRQRRRNPSY